MKRLMVNCLTSLNLIALPATAQLSVGRDTISVIENGYVLKMPWANGVNHANVSNLDLNGDGKKDLVVFDRMNNMGPGRFRCFIKQGNSGQTVYKADPELSYAFPDASSWALLLDYNCDGKEDIFCSQTNGIRVYKNTSGSLVNFTLAKSILRSDFTGIGGPNNAPLFVSAIGVPGIADIDNDGDLDILTFSALGVMVEFHQNMSKELYNTCDSLVFKVATGCWGKFIETGCAINLNQTCSFKPTPLNENQPEQQNLHAGSCVTCIDGDGDGDQDLIMGDIVCNVMQYAFNSGSPSNALIADSTKLYPNYPNKNSTTQLKLNNFPCAYHVDVDGDNKKDLIASPNVTSGENTQSLWYYKNTSLTNTVNFQFVKKNFLQEDMIEVGSNSYPVLFDYNADGKKDLLIGTFGYFNVNTLQARLTLYENIGTQSQPSFSLVSRDYGNLSAQSLNFAMPTVGDIDADGDIDILVGTSNGKVHWLQNSAGAGNVCNFNVFQNNPFNFITQSACAAVQLFDIDQDGKLDMMIGGKNGRIAFYKNTGSLTSPSFSLITNTFGNVDVKGPSTIFGIDGYASPFFYNEAGTTYLLVGSISGEIFYYSVPSATAPCNLISSSANGYLEGTQSTLFYEDINNDGKRDLFIGNASGGLSFFSSLSANVSVKEYDHLSTYVKLFPNPSSDLIHLNIQDLLFESAIITVTDLLSNVMLEIKTQMNQNALDVTGLPKGIYFINIELLIEGQIKRVTKKIVKL